MLNQTVTVLENDFCNELKGCQGYVKEILPEGLYRIALSSKYYGKVYLKENEFTLI